MALEDGAHVYFGGMGRLIVEALVVMLYIGILVKVVGLVQDLVKQGVLLLSFLCVVVGG